MQDMEKWKANGKLTLSARRMKQECFQLLCPGWFYTLARRARGPGTQIVLVAH